MMGTCMRLVDNTAEANSRANAESMISRDYCNANTHVPE